MPQPDGRDDIEKIGHVTYAIPNRQSVPDISPTTSFSSTEKSVSYKVVVGTIPLSTLFHLSYDTLIVSDECLTLHLILPRTAKLPTTIQLHSSARGCPFERL